MSEVTKEKPLSEQEKNDLLSMNIEDEFNEISNDLDKFHSIFYQIWEMGYPKLSFEVPTAAIKFDKQGKRIDFIFNPLFWKQSDRYTKEFVICHECLHVILNHGIRIKDLKNNKLSSMIANYALDVVINHMLVDKFNFDRLSIQNGEDFCWIDTVFKEDHKNVEKNRAFEYYFGLLKNKIIEDVKNSKFVIKSNDGSMSDLDFETIDSHDFLDEIDNEELKKMIEDHLEKNLHEDDKKDFINKIDKTGEGSEKIKESNAAKFAGKGSQGLLFKIDTTTRVKRKKKWETVIKKWSLRFIKEDQYNEQWARVNRRVSDLSSSLMLPSDVEEENKDEDMIEVWFFQDVSGSCIHLKDRFFNAARSLPKERFIIKMFSFDDVVYDVDFKKGEIYGGGGTSFDIIEQKIQREIKKSNSKYPDAVFVITDGYGTHVNPQHPKKWYWFLSYDYKHFIPKECNVYMLNNFE